MSNRSTVTVTEPHINALPSGENVTSVILSNPQPSNCPVRKGDLDSLRETSIAQYPH